MSSRAGLLHEKSSPLISAQEETQSDVRGQVNPSQASGDRLHLPGVEASGDRSHEVQESDDPRQENSGQASEDR